jgi:hypothetical protein
MLELDLLTSEDRALLDGCYNADTAAIAILNSLTAAHPVCQYLLSSAEQGDAQARQTLFRIAFGGPLQREWASRRNIRAANWTRRLNGQVETVYRARLRSIQNEVEDGVQEFWIWFFAEEKDLQYRPERAAEETYVKVLANFRALQHLKRTVIRRVRFLEADDQELDRAAAQVQPQYPAGPDAHSTFVEYVHRLILTNELAPHEAILLMAGVVAGLGPTMLAQQYSNSTLSQICDLIHSALSLPEDTRAMVLVSGLRDQLLLPVERPLGERRLRELATERNRRGNDRRHSERSPGEVFQYWTDQARRVCKHGLQWRDRDRLGGEIAQRMDQKLRTRLDFLTRTLTENKPETEKLWFGLGAKF